MNSYSAVPFVKLLTFKIIIQTNRFYYLLASSFSKQSPLQSIKYGSKFTLNINIWKCLSLGGVTFFVHLKFIFLLFWFSYCQVFCHHMSCVFVVIIPRPPLPSRTENHNFFHAVLSLPLHQSEQFS